MTRALIFPGQGSQKVGMGRALSEAFPAARQVFAEVDDALGRHLSRLMFEGPEETLRLTENAQPALMATSIAIMRCLEADGKTLPAIASHVAGHSLGEYTALCAAGALSLVETARLLHLRGSAMQRAVPVGEGAMAAILGLSLEDVESIAAEAAQGEVCEAANDNAPGQIVISGHVAAIERACALARSRGAKRVMPLPVSAPFHCALMAPAAETMRPALANAALAAPRVPLIANVTAAPVVEPETIRELLIAQITGRVRWRESVLAFPGLGITQAVEIGAGKVLSGLVRRISPEVESLSIESPEDLEAFAATL